MLYSFRTLFLVIFTFLASYTSAAENATGLAPDAINQPMTFINAHNGGNCFGCEWISAEGIITADTPQQFKKILAENFSGDVIINSNGGNLAAALELGRIFRQNELNLRIGHATIDTDSQSYKDGFRFHEITDGICTEACAFAFLGGAARSAQVGSLGLKRNANPTANPNQLVAYLAQMDINPTLFNAMNKQAENVIYFPNPLELVNSGIDNLTVLYSKPALVAFGKNNGKIVETKQLSGYQSTPANTRAYRLYCRGKTKVPHFTVLQNHATPTSKAADRWVEIANLIQSANIQYNKGGYSDTKVKVAAFFNGKNTKAIAFELLDLSAKKFKDIKSISINAYGISKQFLPEIFQLEAKFAYANDVLSKALQNCVEWYFHKKLANLIASFTIVLSWWLNDVWIRNIV